MPSHLIRNKFHTVIKLQIPSLTLSSSFTLIQLFCEYTRNTRASRPLHIMPFAWNILPPDVHGTSSLISFSVWESVTLLQRTTGNLFWNYNNPITLSFSFASLFFIALTITTWHTTSLLVYIQSISSSSKRQRISINYLLLSLQCLGPCLTHDEGSKHMYWLLSGWTNEMVQNAGPGWNLRSLR